MSLRLQRAGSTAVRLVAGASLLLTSLNGCATGQGPFATAADRNDACGAQHAAFADSKSFYVQEVATGALLGGAGGALLGALTASATGGDAGKGALIGFGTGAVAGGAMGYANAQSREAQDRAALANSVYGNVSQAADGIDRATTTFGLLRDCRFAAAARIKSAVQAGTLPRDQGAQQLADLRRRFQDEIAVARQYGTKMDEQDAKLRKASDDLLKDDPEAQQIVADRARITPYFVANPVNIRSAPSEKSDIVAALGKGQMVYVTPGTAANGWQKVTLERGLGGFVPARSLSLTAPAATPLTTVATPPAKPPVNTTNRSAQIAVAATETIPEKRVAFSKSVDSAAEQSNLTFDLNQAG